MERITQEELNEAIDAHEVWLAAEGKKGARLELANLDLSGLDISGKVLSNAVLEGLDMSHMQANDAVFNGAHIDGTTMAHIQGRGAVFADAEMNDVVMTHADLRETQWADSVIGKIDMDGADLYMARLDGAGFTEDDLKGANRAYSPEVRAAMAAEHGSGSIDEMTARMTDAGYPDWEVAEEIDERAHAEEFSRTIADRVAADPEYFARAADAAMNTRHPNMFDRDPETLRAEKVAREVGGRSITETSNASVLDSVERMGADHAPSPRAVTGRLTQEQLDALITEHGKWLDGEGERLHLYGADIRGLDVSGRNLEGIVIEFSDLRGTVAQGTGFVEARIHDSMLQGMDARGADFSNSTIRSSYADGADFAEANLTDAKYVMSSRPWTLNGATLDGSTLANDPDALRSAGTPVPTPGQETVARSESAPEQAPATNDTPKTIQGETMAETTDFKEDIAESIIADIDVLPKRLQDLQPAEAPSPAETQIMDKLPDMQVAEPAVKPAGHESPRAREVIENVASQMDGTEVSIADVQLGDRVLMQAEAQGWMYRQVVGFGEPGLMQGERSLEGVPIVDKVSTPDGDWSKNLFNYLLDSTAFVYDPAHNRTPAGEARSEHPTISIEEAESLIDGLGLETRSQDPSLKQESSRLEAGAAARNQAKKVPVPGDRSQRI